MDQMPRRANFSSDRSTAKFSLSVFPGQDSSALSSNIPALILLMLKSLTICFFSIIMGRLLSSKGRLWSHLYTTRPLRWIGLQQKKTYCETRAQSSISAASMRICLFQAFSPCVDFLHILSCTSSVWVFRLSSVY